MSVQRVIDGRFALGDEVGSGGMAAVHRGVDLETSETVAIKLLHDLSADEIARFEREAELLAGFSHPGIPRYLAHGTAGGAPYLVEQWLDGPTLADRLDGAGLGVGESVAMAAAVAGALAHVHARGVVHRDIKPENLILAGGDPAHPVLIDFGVARVDRTRGLTITGMMLGTLGYMSPEQARGERGIGPAADLFGLGCVLYECLTGHPAFAGSNDTAVWAKVLLLRPPSAARLNPEVPPALADLVDRLLAKEVDARPADAAAVAAELARSAPPAASQRRPRGSPEPATLPLDARVPAGEVYLMHVGGAGDPPVAPPSLPAVAARFAARVEPLIDGSSVLVFAGGAEQAAHCALAVDRLGAGVPIVIGRLAAGTPAAASAIDWLAQAAERLEFAGLWATHVDRDAGAPRVLVDDDTAERLRAGFELAAARGGHALLGARDSG